MTGEDAKNLYKYARSGSGSPYGNIYADLVAPPPRSQLQGTLEGMGPTGVYLGRNFIPGIGHVTRAPQVLAQRHYINLARKAGLYPQGPRMSLMQNLSRKGGRAISKEWDAFVKAMSKEHGDDVIFKTLSRAKPQRAITGKMLPKLTKAMRNRTWGAAFAILEPLLETAEYTMKRPRILKANRAKGHYIGLKNPFLRKA